tara:strand:- start:232 stop:348 length:117 start_codon:yes stop_codon:yes gene_type:complete
LLLLFVAAAARARNPPATAQLFAARDATLALHYDANWA